MKLIDKDALVAEIENLENRYKKCPTRNSYEEGLKAGRLIGYKDTLYKINTLEVKEVDLEKEVKNFTEDLFHNAFNEDKSQDRFWNAISTVIEYTAKHFFELGMQQSNNDKNNEEKS